MSTIAERVKERSLRNQPWTEKNRMKKILLIYNNEEPKSKSKKAYYRRIAEAREGAMGMWDMAQIDPEDNPDNLDMDTFIKKWTEYKMANLYGGSKPPIYVKYLYRWI